MSCVVIGFPIGLAMWTAIAAASTPKVVQTSKEIYKDWLASTKLELPTSFRSSKELIKVVQKCGYDCVKWDGRYKTEINGTVIFWEKIFGRWHAVSASYDAPVVRKFVDRVNDEMKMEIFNMDKAKKALEESEKAASRLWTTSFTDGDLLIKALADKGFSVKPDPDGNIICAVDAKSALCFRPVENGPYSVEVKNIDDLSQVHRELVELDGHYRQLIQQRTVQNIKNRAKSRNMTIESETVMQDQSVVIVLNVEE
ncbi:MAG: hypothetical protein PHX74_05265 [Candidatus Sumerlaeales bacterium]|nr:hypothetical protein [Candidatus Sumerlaeales bacterium]